MNQVAHQAGVYPSFCSMKQLGIFLLHLDGMLAHRKVTLSTKFCPRTKRNVPSQGLNQDSSIWRQAHKP